MALVVDASVALKWFLPESDSHIAAALRKSERNLLIPDFWLHEAINVLWREVRRTTITPDEARQGLALLRGQIKPTPTAHMNLHELALDIGVATNHATYDTMYVAFALTVQATAVVVADRSFVRTMRTHPDPALAAMVLPLDEWAATQGSPL